MLKFFQRRPKKYKKRCHNLQLPAELLNLSLQDSEEICIIKIAIRSFWL